MIRHTVMFRWSDGVDDDHVAALSAALDALPAAIPQIRAYRHGRDVGVNEGNFDYVVVGDFDSVDDYVAYRDDPVHRQLIDDLVAGRVAERAAVQFEYEG